MDKRKSYNLIDYLLTGKENALTARDLAKFLNTNTRQITLEIHHLRTKGELICSNTTGDNQGYYIPSRSEEIQEFCRVMRSRIRQMNKAVKPAEEYLKVNGGADHEN